MKFDCGAKDNTGIETLVDIVRLLPVTFQQHQFEVEGPVCRCMDGRNLVEFIITSAKRVNRREREQIRSFIQSAYVVRKPRDVETENYLLILNYKTPKTVTAVFIGISDRDGSL